MDTENRKTILIVDDNSIIAMSEANDLDEYGYRIITAVTARKAFEIIENNPGIDLILMDIDLGGGTDGMETAIKILEKRDVPLIFLSSHDDATIIKKTERITPYGYILKGSGGIILNTSVKMALRLHESMRKESEQARMLQESEKKFRMLIENLNEGVWYIDREAHTIFVNPRMAEMLGYSKDEMLGKHLFDFMDESGIEFAKEKIERRKHGIKEQHDFEFKRKDGRRINVLMETSPITDDNGNYIGALAGIQDITERKTAEDRVNSLIAEKELLLKEVHHRIKNNMNGLSSLLAIHAGSINNPEIAAVLHDVRNRIQSMATLYHKLYTSDSYRELPVKDYISSLIMDIIMIFPDRVKVKVIKKIDDFILSAEVLYPLGIIINELMTNALKHAFTGMDGGIISVSILKREFNVEFSVSDNGNGIPDNILKSEGFGLKLVKILSKQLNGDFKIERKNGTRCELIFPI